MVYFRAFGCPVNSGTKLWAPYCSGYYSLPLYEHLLWYWLVYHVQQIKTKLSLLSLPVSSHDWRLNGSIIAQIAVQFGVWSYNICSLHQCMQQAKCKKRKSCVRWAKRRFQQDRSTSSSPRQARVRRAHANTRNGRGVGLDNVFRPARHICVLAAWMTQRHAAFVSFTQKCVCEMRRCHITSACVKLKKNILFYPPHPVTNPGHLVLHTGGVLHGGGGRCLTCLTCVCTVWLVLTQREGRLHSPHYLNLTEVKRNVAFISELELFKTMFHVF